MSHNYMLTSTRPDGVTITVYVSKELAQVLEPFALSVDKSSEGLDVLEMSPEALPYAYNEK